jgi:hypothetical protein
MIERFSLCCDSCAREVQNIFAMFLKKTELAQECSAELKILNHLPEMIDNSYRELCTKTTILNTKTDQKGNCAICL